MATIFLKPNLPLNVAMKARIDNKLIYLESVTKRKIGSKLDFPVIIFKCSRKRLWIGYLHVKAQTFTWDGK